VVKPSFAPDRVAGSLFAGTGSGLAFQQELGLFFTIAPLFAADRPVNSLCFAQ
jgi:hypothetical protein